MAKANRNAGANLAQGRLNDIWNESIPQRQDMYNRYINAADRANADYDSITSGYRDYIDRARNISGDVREGYAGLANGSNNAAWDPEFRGGVSHALGGYRDFAETGGFTPQGLRDIRARAISPTRAVYSNAQDELNRARALGGGSMNNYGAVSAKLARDVSQQVSDANVNANAGIAQMVQQGRLAGLQGEGGLSLGAQDRDTAMSALNNQTRLAGLSGMSDVDKTRLAGEDAGLRGLSGMYSATPGAANMYGNQYLNAQDQWLKQAALQNQLGLGVQATNKGNGWLQNTAGILGLLGKGAGFLKYFGIGGSGKDGSYVDAQGYDPYGNYIGGSPNAGYPGNFS